MTSTAGAPPGTLFPLWGTRFFCVGDTFGKDPLFLGPCDELGCPGITVTVLEPPLAAGACPDADNFALVFVGIGANHEKNSDGWLCQTPGRKVVVDNTH